MSNERVTDYFIVAGLPEKPVHLEDTSGDLKPTSKNESITDVCVIIPQYGEECPPGYRPLLHTPTGEIADLNHGSIRSPEVFICLRRGRDKSPLIDIGVLYEGTERVLEGCEVIYTTPYGRPANINNTSSRMYLTYRRADEAANSDILAVTDICVINASKGEKAPHSFCKIDKNLNQGMMSSSVYLCYKKSMRKDYAIAYEPGVLSRYPAWDWPDFPLPESSVAMFGLPMGAMLESLPDRAAQPKSVFSTFVLTGLDGKKVYGAAVTFYELYKDSEKLTTEQSKTLGLHLKKKRRVYVNKAICVLAKRPFFSAFRTFLQFIYRETLNGKPKDLPVERLISHFMWEVPFPSPERPRVLAQLSDNSTATINLPDESPIPLSGSSFSTMLRNLGVENTISLLTMVLLEKKILIHSLRPAVLTGVIEAVGSMIFPFSWQCPYIPLCPLGISEVLFAPLPYIVGVDSRYFDLYDPPPEVACVDLDTNTISKPSDNKLLPKRPTKVLRATLEKYYYEAEERGHGHATDDKSLAAEKVLDTNIQEAFLRFMAAILKGYKNFLLPITTAPSEAVATSVKQLFDVKGFIKSRDKAYHKLFEQMVRTQAFTRFIEERSFNTRGDTSFLFFDECTENVDENYDIPKLLEIDPYKSDRTVYISPPLPDGTLTPPYTYDYFPNTFNSELFLNREKPADVPGVDSTLLADKKTFIAKRSKVEVKASLKVASASRKGVASSTLWSKCLVNNTFSLWFVHLPSFILASQSPLSTMRAACAILKKLQEYRLYTPDEMPYCTMMQLCGIYKLPVLAVLVLCEMRSINLPANAVTYGYYNQAVLESKWPSETSNALVKWRRIRHLVMAISQLKAALKNKKSQDDVDSLSRESVASDEIIPAAKTHKDDVISTASDVGYGSMSQEDIHKSGPKTVTSAKVASAGKGNDVFRIKMGCIIKRSVDRENGNSPLFLGSYYSSAGLLITTDRALQKISLSNSLSSDSKDGKRKRHKSAGDSLKQATKQAASDLHYSPLVEVDSSVTPLTETPLPSVEEAVVSHTPNHLPLDTTSVFSQPERVPCASVLDSKPTNNNVAVKAEVEVMFDPLSAGAMPISASESSLSRHSLDYRKSSTDSLRKETGNLFGRDSSLKTNSADETVSMRTVKKYNLLEFSPEKEVAPALTPGLRKSLSLDSRASYQAAIKDEDSKSADAVLDAPKFEKPSFPPNPNLDGSKESIKSSGGDSLSSDHEKGRRASSSYKSWVTSSIKKGANLAIAKNLSSKMKSMVYGEKEDTEPHTNMSSHESLDSVDTTSKINKRGDMRSSIKKFKSVSSNMASKLYSNYNKLKHTVKEYQAPSTVSTPYKEDKQSEHRNSEDNISLLSSHSALGLPFSIDDSLSGFDDGGKSFSTDITYSGVSSAFITKYTTSPSAQVMLDAVDSLFKFPPPSSVSTPSMSEPVIEVVMCSSTVCDNCSTILYDEDIMAGWSAQDSELSTTCRFCDNKQLPFMMIDIKDLRAKDTFDKNSAFTDDGVLSSPPLTPRSSQTNRIEPIKLPYLSPIVLRKELESVLDREGDVCLTSSSFVDNHAIVYWNLMWYFKRMNFPSHLPQLLFHSSCLTFNNIELPSPQPSNMILRLVWNHPRLHEKMAAPMYKLWNESGSKSTVVRALLTDEKAATRSFMQQMLTHVECNDIYTPLKMIINNRKLYKRNSNNRCQSAYRDILFLAFVYFGREVMDHDAFDREYKLAFKRLELTDKLHLTKSDAPPSPTVMWCRKLYGNLEVC